MSRLPILRYPDPRLNKVSKPVSSFDVRLKRLVDDMTETMYDAPGIGLAAPQVDVHEQIVIIDISESRTDLRVFINPKIVWTSPEKAIFEEGCLSVPGIYDEIERPAKVKICALDLNGKSFELTADGLMAVCVQHEVDHLRGFLFVEFLSQLKRNRIKAKMVKEEREIRRDMSSPVNHKR